MSAAPSLTLHFSNDNDDDDVFLDSFALRGKALLPPPPPPSAALSLAVCLSVRVFVCLGRHVRGTQATAAAAAAAARVRRAPIRGKKGRRRSAHVPAAPACLLLHFTHPLPKKQAAAEQPNDRLKPTKRANEKEN